MGNCKDPIYEEFKFCKECEPKVRDLVVYIRQLENAQVVAKQALETIKIANDKLTKEQHMLLEENHTLNDRLKGKTAKDIKDKMDALDAAHNRFRNRAKLIGA